MNLNAILLSLGLRGVDTDVEISSVTEDISEVKKGSLFFAVKGRNTDGSMFIEKALQMGAAAVICQDKSFSERVYTVDDVRVALSKVSCMLYYPSSGKMKLIGITGTNGKSTTAGYLRHILSENGRKTAVIGTLGSVSENSFCDTGFTTPRAEILYKELEKHAQSGNEFCIIEVSSQALSLKRVYPLAFSLGIFTNAGNDHIEWHGTRENYLNAKKQLFYQCESALINADDEFSSELTGISAGGTYTYSLKDDYSDYVAKNIRIKKDEVSYLMLDEFGLCKIRFQANGEFSVYNSLAAAAAANILGVSHSEIGDTADSLPVIKGRMEKISSEGIDVYIDFAHTPEALKNALSTLGKVTEGRVICVFGCGGDRDKGKRAVMGKIAEENSDVVILTSDNPRNESPEDIIEDILSGIKNINKIYKEEDREKAISLALKKAKRGDSVLIAGKGHESYLIYKDEKKYFSDEITVKKIFGV